MKKETHFFVLIYYSFKRKICTERLNDVFHFNARTPTCASQEANDWAKSRFTEPAHQWPHSIWRLAAGAENGDEFCTLEERKNCASTLANKRGQRYCLQRLRGFAFMRYINLLLTLTLTLTFKRGTQKRYQPSTTYIHKRNSILRWSIFWTEGSIPL